MKIGVLVLAIFVFYALAPEVGLAGRSALVGAKSGNGQSWDIAVSEGKKTHAAGFARNARVYNSHGETAKVMGISQVIRFPSK
jgi:hypothetical protein